MSRLCALVFLLWWGVLSFGLSPYEAGASQTPRAVFASIAPYYDYMDPSLKPWHVKIDYQLYDQKGNPSENGVFEYWWASPKVYRMTWTRGQSIHTDWHSADGRHLTKTTGEPLGLYDFWLQTAFLSPLPSPADLDSAKSIIVDHDLGSNGHVRCMMVVPFEVTESVARTLPFGTFPEYCVNKALPLLLGYSEFGNIQIRCVDFTQMQGKSMPREIQIIDGSQPVLSAKAEAVTPLNATDPALIPGDDAMRVPSEWTQVSPDVESRLLVKRVAPIYPADAKSKHIEGKVVLQATVGPEGRVENVRLVSTPSASLALSAFQSVSQWEYKPYRVNGEAVTVESNVVVDFSLADGNVSASQELRANPRE
jgi:TonB family protein